jgi:hypothetical protein
MLFLIRAIFWLSIVSYFLPWPEDKIALFLTKCDLKSEAQDILGRTVGMAAERECLRVPATCLKEAARLSRMAAGHLMAGKDKAPSLPPVDAPSARH